MKLSIITINYNNVVGLRKTMESVIAQTYQDFEFIIVDGASTDGSVGVIRELEAKCPDGMDFRWASEPDTGIYNAMNKGISKAKGEYVLMLNSGDFLAANDALLKVFESEPSADVVNARCNVTDEGQVVWTSPYLPKVTLKTLYTVGLPHQSTFIKRTLFDQFGLYREDFHYNSDIAFWYKAIVFGGATTQGLNTIIVDYDKNGVSGIHSSSERYKMEMQEILSEGILPRVLPDYDDWAKEEVILRKYLWIESHRYLQRLLSFSYKVFKHI